MQKNFDKTFHYFRAFAIFSVLGAHMWIAPKVADYERSWTFLECLRSVLFHSSTLYFIFISGYLFDFVYQRKTFELDKFYLSKVRNVLAPYFFLSCLFIGISILLEATGRPVPFFINHGQAMTTLAEIADALVFGRADITYWYIPFILSVYVIAPVLFLVDNKKLSRLVLVAAFVPLIFTRDELTDFFLNYCFFFPVFLLGVHFARNREPNLAFLRRHARAIALVAVLSSLFLVFEYYEPHLPSPETVYYIQKLSIGALVILAFERMQGESRLLDLLATVSFPLYFLHDPVICLAQKPLFALGSWIMGPSPFLISVCTFAAELGLCLVVIKTIKALAGKRSRLLIGA